MFPLDVRSCLADDHDLFLIIENLSLSWQVEDLVEVTYVGAGKRKGGGRREDGEERKEEGAGMSIVKVATLCVVKHDGLST